MVERILRLTLYNFISEAIELVKIHIKKSKGYFLRCGLICELMRTTFNGGSMRVKWLTDLKVYVFNSSWQVYYNIHTLYNELTLRLIGHLLVILLFNYVCVRH